MAEKALLVTEWGGKELKLYWQDLWLISQIREVGFGKLSEVVIQDGVVVLVNQCEKKLKPQKVEEGVC